MIVIWWYSVVVSISGCDPLDPGSNPGTAITFCLLFRLSNIGGLAHSVERSVRNRQAGGSKPPSSTFSFAAVRKLLRMPPSTTREGPMLRNNNARLTQSVE